MAVMWWLSVVARARRLGRGQQGKDVEEEFGAERTGSTESTP